MYIAIRNTKGGRGGVAVMVRLGKGIHNTNVLYVQSSVHTEYTNPLVWLAESECVQPWQRQV